MSVVNESKIARLAADIHLAIRRTMPGEFPEAMVDEPGITPQRRALRFKLRWISYPSMSRGCWPWNRRWSAASICGSERRAE